MSFDLGRLDPAQRLAVTAPDGPVLVFAGAGSGKTRALTTRIAWLIRERGVSPSRIMAVTFTRKAAEEMRSRLRGLLPLESDGTDPLEELRRVGTFHAQMAMAMRRLPSEALAGVGRTASFTIWDEDDRRSAVGLAAKAANVILEASKRQAVGSQISTWKNAGLSPAEVRVGMTDPLSGNVIRPDLIPGFAARIWPAYQAAVRAANACDFDDLLILPTELMTGDDTLRRRWSGGIDHLLVDEFQDTNVIQLRLIELLSSVNKNLFVVGDDAQSIYRFRGARIENILQFGSRFPTLTQVTLTTNYRSTQAIVEVANAILARSGQNIRKRLVAAEGTPAGQQPALCRFPDEEIEAAFIVREAATLHAGGVALSELAVLVRTRAQTRALEAAAVRAGLPYRVVGGVHFYAQAEVKDLLAWLRVICNPRDGMAVRRALSAPRRGIGDKTLEILGAAAETAEGDWISACRAIAAGGAAPAAARRSLAEFADLVEAWTVTAPGQPTDLLVGEVLERSGLLRSSADGTLEGVTRAENLREVGNAAAPFGVGGLAAFLEETVLESEAAAKSGAEALTIATLHAAKGLEWKAVWLAGCEEGLLPHASAFGDEDELEEERRLAYVGVTRAKRRLVLTAVDSRFVNGTRNEQALSRFARDAMAVLRVAPPVKAARRPGAYGRSWQNH
jgi:DNA helicase-2/ATP-dependent DNA helicase PcrA